MAGKKQWNPDWSTQTSGSGAPQAAGGSVRQLAKRKRVVIPAALIALLFAGSVGSNGSDDDAPVALTAAAGEGGQTEAADRDAAENDAEDAAADAAADRAAAEAALQQAEADKAAAEKAKAELAAQEAATERAAAEAAAAAAAAEAAQAAETARVAADKAAADKAAAEAAQVQTLAAPPAAASGSAGTDPRFGTCKEALANGYGGYRQGVDAEYDWYRDADNDGVVCE